MLKNALLLILVSPAFCDSPNIIFYQPRNVRPEVIEETITRTVPKAGVATYPAQNGVIISGDDDTIKSISKLLDYLDRPGQVLELEIGMNGANNNSDAVTGIGGTVTRDVEDGREIPPAPSEFRRSRSFSNDYATQSLMVMPGKPAELFIGETQFRDAGPLNPPIEVQAGRRITVDNVRIVEGGAEFDIAIENTVPGSGPVVSSGTRLRTSIRLAVGETTYVSTADGDTDSGGTNFDSDYDRSGGFARLRNTKRRGSSSGGISVTLKRIR